MGLGTRPWGLQYAGATPLPTSGAGTTLQAVARPQGSSGYRRLEAGPGWQTIVRDELAEAASGREDRRTALASFVQLTDVHIVDAQSPVRFEYVEGFAGSAYRPQETLTTQGLAALVRQVNTVASGPYTGRAFDAVVTTGDNTDNKETVELDWFLTAMNGGTITPNTGDPDTYEGVQDSGADLYWNPGLSIQDIYKKAGFPDLPGLLDAAITPFTSPGLNTPWYCVFGNHDDSVQGTLPNGITLIEEMYTGSRKFELPPTKESMSVGSAASSGRAGDVLTALSAVTTPRRTVTADLSRKPFTPEEFIAEHLKPENTGPGPVGHGFNSDAGETGIGYYTFEIAPGVIGISMDSTNRAGTTEGSLGEAQFRWIEKTLRDGSSRYYDTDGSPVAGQGSDTWFILFSHHTSWSMDDLEPDPTHPSERRIPGAELVDLLHRFPNVLAWVNGHTHRNRIKPWEGSSPDRSFWEINTASHIDFPQLGRIIEVADNADGTVSLLATLFEADSPYSVNYTDLSPLGLASLYREFSFNDSPDSNSNREGKARDQNVELLLESGRS